MTAFWCGFKSLLSACRKGMAEFKLKYPLSLNQFLLSVAFRPHRSPAYLRTGDQAASNRFFECSENIFFAPIYLILNRKIGFKGCNQTELCQPTSKIR